MNWVSYIAQTTIPKIPDITTCTNTSVDKCSCITRPELSSSSANNLRLFPIFEKLKAIKLLPKKHPSFIVVVNDNLLVFV